MIPPPPRSTLFPYTTLFRSHPDSPGPPGCIWLCGNVPLTLRRNHADHRDRKSTRLNSSHQIISYAVFCLKKKKKTHNHTTSHKFTSIHDTTVDTMNNKHFYS